MLNRLKCIQECIDYLKNNYHTLPIEEPNRSGYAEAIDHMESYLIDEQEILEDQYGEYYQDRYSDSKYCF